MKVVSLQVNDWVFSVLEDRLEEALDYLIKAKYTTMGSSFLHCSYGPAFVDFSEYHNPIYILEGKMASEKEQKQYLFKNQFNDLLEET